MSESDGQDDDEGLGYTSGVKIVVALAVGLGVVVGGYFVVGMPGMDMSAPMNSTAETGQDVGDMAWTRQDVDQFAETVDGEGAVVVNVHVPNEGSIAGTDLTIPYTEVLADPMLPSDRDTQLALYCRSGRMSTVAAQVLVEAGYTNVVELDGGMDAWAAAGRPLQP